jgi:hypothetical protein
MGSKDPENCLLTIPFNICNNVAMFDIKYYQLSEIAVVIFFLIALFIIFWAACPDGVCPGVR